MTVVKSSGSIVSLILVLRSTLVLDSILTSVLTLLIVTSLLFSRLQEEHYKKKTTYFRKS